MSWNSEITSRESLNYTLMTEMNDRDECCYERQSKLSFAKVQLYQALKIRSLIQLSIHLSSKNLDSHTHNKKEIESLYSFSCSKTNPTSLF